MAYDKKSSIVELLIYLWQKTDSRHLVTNKDITLYMESKGYTMDRKTIPEHIDSLNLCLESLGLEIIKESLGNKNAYYLSGKSFEIEQITEIIMAVIQSKSVSDSNSKEFINKLYSQVSEYEEKEIRESLSSSFPVVRRSNSVSYCIGQIVTAINQGKKISIDYIKDMYSREKSINKREVSPFCLTCNDNAMYLMGYCQKHNKDCSFFRLDRMYDVEILDEPANWEGKKHAMENIHEYNKKMTIGDPVTVILEFDKDISPVIYDRYGNITPKSTAFGYVISESDILCDELLGWLVTISSHIKIRGNEELKKRFKKRMQELSNGDIFA